jgi:hypothetical protein
LAVVEVNDELATGFGAASIMSLHEAQAMRQALNDFVSSNVLVENIDYGKVPGTDKNTLLKPGAEKLATFFRLTPKFVILDKVVDFDKGLFYFQYQCELYTRGGMLVGTGNGSCNSYESKYRYRRAGRVCPQCGAENIRRSKRDDGWYCWEKTGGCGANFAANDTRITEQETGRVENPDRADQLNTVDKMAQKRALVAAVLIAVNASEFFTQDMEDFVNGDFEPPPVPPKRNGAPAPAQSGPPEATRPTSWPGATVAAVANALAVEMREAMAALNAAEAAGEVTKSDDVDSIIKALTIDAPEAQLVNSRKGEVETLPDETPAQGGDEESPLVWPDFYEWAKETGWQPLPDELEDYRNTEMWFGKNKGKTLGDIADNDRGYAKWLSESCENVEARGIMVYLRAVRKLAEESGQPELL